MKSKPARSARCGRLDEMPDQRLDLVFAQRVRRRPAFGIGDRRSRDDRPRVLIGGQRAIALPGPPVGGLAAGMGKLGAELRARRRHAFGRIERAFRSRFIGVGIEAEAAMADAAAPLHARHLDGDHARARHCEVHPVLQVPVGRRAVIGRILAHRRHSDAVREVEVGQCDRGKKMRGHESSGDGGKALM